MTNPALKKFLAIFSRSKTKFNDSDHFLNFLYQGPSLPYRRLIFYFQSTFSRLWRYFSMVQRISLIIYAYRVDKKRQFGYRSTQVQEDAKYILPGLTALDGLILTKSFPFLLSVSSE